MSPLTETLKNELKNEHTKRILHVTGVRRPSLVQRQALSSPAFRETTSTLSATMKAL